MSNPDGEFEGSAEQVGWPRPAPSEMPYPSPSGGSASWRPGSPVTPVGGARPGGGGSFGGTPGGGGMYGTGWFPAPPAPKPPRRHRRILYGASALLIVVAAAAGVGIGHEVWPSTSAVASAAQGTTSPSTSGGTGSGSAGSGSTGSGSSGSSSSGGSSSGLPYGSGTPGGYIGQTPFGSSGGTSSGASEGSGGPSDVASVAAKVDPALVDINSTFSYQQAEGAGTGIVLTSTGEVLTNNHVVNGATKISVTDVGNGKTYSATVVGYNSTDDMAVVQLKDASGLQTAKFANSSKLAVGESVVAIGNAGGSGGTPTSAGGSVTALQQSITASDDLDGTNEQLSGLIEVNADVQAGDSGGSLVNNAGEVIGMDTAGSSESSFQSGGLGYAIPIDEVLSTAAAIEAGQGSSLVHVGATAFLGVLIGSSDAEGSGAGGSTTSGATLSGTASGGPAAKAGLVAGDVITSFDGQTVESSSTISKLMVTLRPGDKVELGWVDTSGQSHTATVDLASGPPA